MFIKRNKCPWINIQNMLPDAAAYVPMKSSVREDVNDIFPTEAKIYSVFEIKRIIAFSKPIDANF